VFVDKPDDFRKITHLIASDGKSLPQPNRLKMLVAFCQTPNIMVSQWIHDSNSVNCFLPEEVYRIAWDHEGFSMKQTILDGTTARGNGGVLHSRSIYLSPGVARKDSNLSRSEFSMLFEATGAREITLAKLKKSTEHSDLIIMISASTAPKADVQKAIDRGARVLTAPDFLDIIKRQRFGSADIAPTTHAKGIPPSTAPTAKAKSTPSRPDQARVANAKDIMRKFGFQPVPQSCPKKSDPPVPNSSHNAYPKTKEVQCQTEQEWQPEVLFKTKLERPITRTISNPNVGNPEERSTVGLGIARVILTKKGSVTLRCFQLIGEEGELKMEALIPPAKTAHKHLHVHSTEMNTFAWDAYDSSEYSCAVMADNNAKTIQREFTIRCKDSLQMMALLFHMFGAKDEALLREFLDSNGRFVLKSKTAPPHPIAKIEDAMDDSEWGVVARKAPLNQEDEEIIYGEVNYMTQEF